MVPVLDILLPLNESRLKYPLFMTEHFIDEQKYYYPIYFHLLFVMYSGIVVVVATDSYVANVSQHIIGLTKILRYCIDIIFTWKTLVFVISNYNLSLYMDVFNMLKKYIQYPLFIIMPMGLLAL